MRFRRDWTAARFGLLCLTSPALVTVSEAQPAATSKTLQAVRVYRTENSQRVLDELVAFLEIPNVASDSVNIRRNALHLVSLLEARRFDARLLETTGAPPAVYGELRVPGATRTVVFYAHYDGQPADAARWQSTPWTPILRDGALHAGAKVLPRSATHDEVDGEWRLYARSASDDKSPIVAMLTALDALRAQGVQPSVNLKFFFEGEEEAGSPHLETLLKQNAALLAADLWIFCDGPIHQSGFQQVVFGVRGVIGVNLTVYGPLRPLHSGHYGNWAPNPAAMLSTMLGAMRAPDGRVLIDGFYGDVRALSAAESAAVGEVPAVEAQLLSEFGLASAEGPDALLLDRILQPAMNVRGLASGAVGSASRNAIPTQARASIDFRLVPVQDPARVRQQVESHLRSRGYFITRGEPTAAERQAHAKIVRVQWGSGYPSMRTPLDLAVSRAVVRAVEEASPTAVVRVPTLGGSLPLYLFRQILGVPLIVVPMVNHDNNQHAPDENLRLQNLWNGIDMYANVMARLGELW
jgi:acetylornithine deacetylase/succinyl-diaminopimelate desuccinylase-like protein